MTRRHELEHHRQALVEIRDIMNSMKTLAYMETRKLRAFLDAQGAVVQSIEDVAADLLSFHPGAIPRVKEATPVCVLIGTERGFCGDFNQALLREMESAMQDYLPENPLIIATGRKLYSLMEGSANITARIDGATVVEEVTAVLSLVVDEFSKLQRQNPLLDVFVLHHGSRGDIVVQKLLPPFQRPLGQPPGFAHPPLLNQDLRSFLAELTDHYLFAALHGMLYASLMAENQQRVAHLEGAMKHLEDKTGDLVRRCNILRQAEIIEEIEINLLSGGDFTDNETSETVRSS